MQITVGETVSAERFASQMEALNLRPLPPALAVAVSGGADSMALAWLAGEWAQRHGIRLVAFTVDHGLRDGSSHEAEQVGQWLAARGIPHHILRWESTDKPQANLQAQAREARYQLLASACAEQGITHLLLGHHLDDQAETFLIRLQRGSGVDGLAAMRPVSSFKSLILLRPLLDTPKSALTDFLAHSSQVWIEDPSNHAMRHTRTRMRHLLPKLAEAGIGPETLAATSRRMARARDFLERQTDRAALYCLTLHDEGYITLNEPRFLDLHEEIALRLLADILRLMNGTVYRPRLSELEMLYHALPGTRTLAGCRFITGEGRNRGKTFVLRELAHAASPITLHPHRPTLWDGRFEVTLLSEHPVELGVWGHPAPEADVSIPKRVIPVLPVLRLENAVLLPHIPSYKGELLGEGCVPTASIRCEIRTFPLRDRPGCG